MKEFIQKILSRADLTQSEASSAMRTIMEGIATDAQIGAFLTGLAMKGETAEELLGFVETMREKSVKVAVEDPNAIDMCGTGGDGSGTFNISTAASFVVAGAGVTVAKHGNRSISSSSGSADVLKALGVNIELSPERIQASINSVGIGFLFAPLFHPAMKHAAKPRSELGIKTCFNMLGPLTNPAGVKRQLVGAFNKKSAERIAEVFQRLQPDHVCVVSSYDGLDEISLQEPTAVWEIKNGRDFSRFAVDPRSFNLNHANGISLTGGTPEDNATVIMGILNGEQGAHRNIVLINAAVGIYIAGKAVSPLDALALAEESLDSGRALQKLRSLIEFTNQ